MLKDKVIILGVTGGIAAYKACEVVSTLKQLGAEVWVVMTESATKLVTPLTFRTLSTNPVITDLFSNELAGLNVPHIALTEKADLVMVVPATANIIGKAASGIADDPLSTMLLSSKAKKLFAPAMNTRMWNNSVVQENIKKLKDLGVQFIGPVEGNLACGWGMGKMAEPEEIVNRVIEILVPKLDFKGKRVLITAGGTREPLDPVRFIGNRSSGKMGFALAQAARTRGAKVTLISGPTHEPLPLDVELVKVETAAEMKAAVLERFKYADLLVMAAAVADYRPAKASPKKLKKVTERLQLLLERTEDILAAVKRLKTKKQKVVGFALETEDVLAGAAKKLKEKGLDLVVANDPSTFDGDLISGSILSKDGKPEHFSGLGKDQAAGIILDRIKGI
ncbi:MAG: bifunctional phosphopantothenoylcysteine decarboxylase/phosphopantothenate--cysteine ligase CoaBC [Candidatus Saganbacteria bacterium]|nr:bifunctional phosphopantothenoylcysteine decarboxylase/phosphopantothenate--cysteine ligase CoaBC [Candidatus Saganbacteria bacterium]